ELLLAQRERRHVELEGGDRLALVVGAAALGAGELQVGQVARRAQLVALVGGVGDLQFVDERVAQADLVRDRAVLEGQRAEQRRGLRVGGAQGERGDGERAGDHAAILRARARKKRTRAAPWSSPVSSSTWSRLSFLNSFRRSSRTRRISRAKVPRTSASPASTIRCAPVSGSSSSTSPRRGKPISSGSAITTGTRSCRRPTMRIGCS